MSAAAGKHTPGVWRVGDAGHTVFGPNLGKPSPETVAEVRKPDNARRIAACVNACQPYNDPAEAINLMAIQTNLAVERLLTIDRLDGELDRLRAENETLRAALTIAVRDLRLMGYAMTSRDGRDMVAALGAPT